MKKEDQSHRLHSLALILKLNKMSKKNNILFIILIRLEIV